MEDQGSFLRFCEKLVKYHNTGNMRPHHFCLAQAIFGGYEESRRCRGERLDREMAAKLLEVIEEGEKLFPEMVEKNFLIFRRSKKLLERYCK